jgi:hypothetical protein
MRVYLYVIAGITSALIGWNIGAFFTSDLGLLQQAQMGEIIIFPSVAISLAIGMVLNEIFISNPLRPTLCLRKILIPVPLAFGLGIVFGLAGGGLYQLLFYFGLPPFLVRMLSWLLVGFCVGLAEGLSWSFYTIEAGNKKRFHQRLITSISGACGASILAALLFEFIGNLSFISPQFLGQLDDPIGFSLLGILLGLSFAFTNSPSYLAALRAGAGFEFRSKIQNIDTQATQLIELKPSINPSALQFVGVSNQFNDLQEQQSLDNYSQEYYYHIQEGLSIQLPGKGRINIGSEKSKNAHIILPGIPTYVGCIIMEGRNGKLIPSPVFYEAIWINGEQCDSDYPKTLKHGTVIKICKLKDPLNDKGGINDKEFYRFVYYNRFLDPDS